MGIGSSWAGWAPSPVAKDLGVRAHPAAALPASRSARVVGQFGSRAENSSTPHTIC